MRHRPRNARCVCLAVYAVSRWQRVRRRAAGMSPCRSVHDVMSPRCLADGAGAPLAEHRPHDEDNQDPDVHVGARRLSLRAGPRCAQHVAGGNVSSRLRGPRRRQDAQLHGEAHRRLLRPGEGPRRRCRRRDQRVHGALQRTSVTLRVEWSLAAKTKALSQVSSMVVARGAKLTLDSGAATLDVAMQ